MDIETQMHLASLRQLLDYRLEDLNAEMHDMQQRRTTALAEVDGSEVTDLKDRSRRDPAMDMVRLEYLRLGHELLLVEAALKRLDEGCYGDCVDCGEPIAFERLKVQPEALRCAACQVDYERHLCLR